MTITTGNILEGYVKTRLYDTTKAKFTLTPEYPTTYDEGINIEGIYTSSGVSATGVLFSGIVTKKSYDIIAEAEGESFDREINSIFPTGSYVNFREILLGTLVSDWMNWVHVDETTGIQTLRPTGDPERFQWSDLAAPNGSGDADGWLYDEINEDIDTPDGWAIQTLGDSSYYGMSLSNHTLDTGYHYYIWKVDVKARGKAENSDTNMKINLSSNGGSSYGPTGIINYASTSYVDENIVFTTGYTETGIDAMRIKLQVIPDLGSDELFIDTVEADCHYRTFPGLERGDDEIDRTYHGFLPAKHVFNLITREAGMGWNIDSTGQFRYNELDIFSGKTITPDEDVEFTKAVETVERVNTVYAKCGSSEGVQLVGFAQDTGLTGAGLNVRTVVNTSITDQTEADDYAQTYLDAVSNPLLELYIHLDDPINGSFTVGETIYLQSGCYLIGSNVEIPSGYYITKQQKYNFGPSGAYVGTDLRLIDSIYYETTAEETQELSVQVQQNTYDIQNLIDLSGIDNTAANVGTNGVGVYDGKVAYELQFRNISTGSTKLSITENGNDIDVDIVEANLALSGDIVNISGDLVTVSGDLSTVSGDYSTTSGTISDYPVLSGDYSITSGTVSDYKTVSGSHSNLSGAWTGWNYDITGLSGLTNSVVYVDNNGLVQELGLPSSGLFLASDGTTSAPVWAVASGSAGTNYDADLLIGAANHAWVPCAYMDTYETGTWRASVGLLYNIGSTNTQLSFMLPLPTNRGGKSLYVDGIRVSVYQANATNYVDTIQARGLTYLAATQLVGFADAANRTAQGLYETTPTAVVCSGYEQIVVAADVVTADLHGLRIAGTALRCYYG